MVDCEALGRERQQKIWWQSASVPHLDVRSSQTAAEEAFPPAVFGISLDAHCRRHRQIVLLDPHWAGLISHPRRERERDLRDLVEGLFACAYILKYCTVSLVPVVGVPFLPLGHTPAYTKMTAPHVCQILP